MFPSLTGRRNVRAVRALQHDDLFSRVSAPREIFRSRFRHALPIQVHVELPRVFHRLAIERQDHVANLQARDIGWSIGQDVCEDHAAVARRTQGRCQAGCYGVGPPRRSRPSERIHSFVSDRLRSGRYCWGTAKPRPSLPPDCDRIMVLMPTTRPSISTSAPPLFPGLMGRRFAGR